MEDFVVTCQLVPGVPHLISDSCTSSRTFGLAYLCTPPRDDALGLLLTFGSTNKYLVRGLAPRKSHAMPGTHAADHERPLGRLDESACCVYSLIIAFGFHGQLVILIKANAVKPIETISPHIIFNCG